MRFGLALSSQHAAGDDLGARWKEHLEQVRLAKALGFSSVAATQHYLAAPHQYFQPLPMLARLVDETEGMTLATGVLVLPLHHPIAVAEEVATLDVLSGGRVQMGVALGYRNEENEAFGLDPKQRVSRFEESLQIIERLWTGEPVTFSGRHFQLEDVRISCRPAQRPRPIIAIGASIEKGIRRAAELGDEWVCAPHAKLDTVVEQLAFYRRCREQLGKPPSDDFLFSRECFVAPSHREALVQGARYIAAKYASYHAWGQDDAMPDDETFLLEADELAKDRFVVGDPIAVREELARYRERLGLQSISFRVQWPGMENAQVLRTIRLLGEQVLPYLQV